MLCVDIYAVTNSGGLLANPRIVNIDVIPAVKNGTHVLDVSLTQLRRRIASDANECMDNAEGMGVRGTYEAKVRKTIETSKVFVIEVIGSMSCDGVHSSSCQYAIAFNIKTGKRLDLSTIYAVGIRRNASIFLRPELLDVVKQSYKRANSGNAACFDRSDWERGLRAYSFTTSPLPDGRLILYYSRPDIEAACLPPMVLDARDVKPYRNAHLATEYGLP